MIHFLHYYLIGFHLNLLDYLKKLVTLIILFILHIIIVLHNISIFAIHVNQNIFAFNPRSFHSKSYQALLILFYPYNLI